MDLLAGRKDLSMKLTERLSYSEKYTIHVFDKQMAVKFGPDHIS